MPIDISLFWLRLTLCLQREFLINLNIGNFWFFSGKASNPVLPCTMGVTNLHLMNIPTRIVMPAFASVCRSWRDVGTGTMILFSLKEETLICWQFLEWNMFIIVMYIYGYNNFCPMFSFIIHDPGAGVDPWIFFNFFLHNKSSEDPKNQFMKKN